ncbi:MAG: NUDIX hydrolase [Chloroflexi bacterium]|nr:NUDIX hydrolase [Chloroflexota bacterium]
MNETILHTEKIYQGRVISLAVHQVELENGVQARREIVRHPGAVAIVALNERREVLLVTQFRLAAGKTLREIPAGTLEAGEDPLECAARELQEETGYKPGKLEALGGIFVAPGYTTEYIHLFLATELSPSKLAADADEALHAEFVPLAEALRLAESGALVDAKSNVALLRVARRLGI